MERPAKVGKWKLPRLVNVTKMSSPVIYKYLRNLTCSMFYRWKLTLLERTVSQMKARLYLEELVINSQRGKISKISEQSSVLEQEVLIKSLKEAAIMSIEMERKES